MPEFEYRPDAFDVLKACDTTEYADADPMPDELPEVPVEGYAVDDDPDPTEHELTAAAHAPDVASGTEVTFGPNAGASFLHQRNPRFHASQEVELVANYLRAHTGERIPNEPAAKINAYLGFLADPEYGRDGVLSGDQASLEQQVETHIIKAKDIPKSYYDLQRRIAREQGYGDIPITPEMQRDAERIITADQRGSLGQWAGYLSSGDAPYPAWFKQYAFQQVTRIGKITPGAADLNPEQDAFQKRNSKTTAPFPELSRGGLSMVYSWVKAGTVDGMPQQSIFGDPKSDVYDPAREARFQKALAKGDFATLYAYGMHAAQEGVITAEQKQQVDGSWRTYAAGSDPDGLYGDLQGFGLDWCTATGRATTETHLAGGDFHVFYSQDEQGTDTIPRIAVRMEEGVVAEVRGIDPAQEMESEMLEQSSEFVQGLPGGEAYAQKAQDMRRMTDLVRRASQDPEAVLSSDEVRFLYEMDRPIENFGYDTVPRIKELRDLRGEQDLPVVREFLPEAVHEQLGTAYNAYHATLEGLSIADQERYADVTPEQIAEMFAAVHAKWEQNGVYDFVTKELVHGNTYTLVATPNIEANHDQIAGLIRSLSANRVASICSTNGFFDSEVCGPAGDGPLRFSLVARRSTPIMGDGVPTMGGSMLSTEDRIGTLRQLQDTYPPTNIHVPSVLEAVTYWHSLDRAKIIEQGGYQALYDMTVTDHFDVITYYRRERILLRTEISNDTPELINAGAERAARIFGAGGVSAELNNGIRLAIG